MTIHEKLKYEAERWNLTDLSEVYQLDTRAVYQGKSRNYGECIVKINQDADTLRQEARMLEQLDGQGCCKLYDYDSDQSVLLEERIVPGIVLRKESDLTVRVHQFLGLFHKIHKMANSLDTFPSYIDWLTNADRYMLKSNPHMELTEHMHRALEIGSSMFEKYPERILLHGDLHHDNILKNAAGGYQMIDPKGVIGPAIFDLPRFIMNELDPDLNSTGEKHIQRVIQLVAEELDYSVEEISQLFYMEVILGNCWCVEDQEAPNSSDIEIATLVLRKTG